MTNYLREIVIPIIIKADSVPVHQNERFILDNVLPLLFCNREIERELTSDPCTTPSFASVIKQPCLQSCKKLRNNMNPEHNSEIEQPSTCNLYEVHFLSTSRKSITIALSVLFWTLFEFVTTRVQINRNSCFPMN